MQACLPRGNLAHFSDLLPLRNHLSLTDQQLSIVRVDAQISGVVLDDDQVAVAPQAAAAVDDLTRRAGND